MTTISGSEFARCLKLTTERLREAKRSLKRFESFCALIKTDEGEQLRVEVFQKLILLAYFAGVPEVIVLIPKGNGKTTILAALSIFHMLTHPNPRVYVGASTKEQAKTLYNEALRILKQRKAWRKRLKARPGYNEVHAATGQEDGLLKVLSSDKLGKGDDLGGGTQEGLVVTLGIVEEVHAHINDALYAAIQGGLQKRSGQMLVISTAGGREDTLLGRIRANAHAWKDKLCAGALTIALAPGREAVLFEWGLKLRSEAEDIDRVKEANPASFVTKAKLRKLRASPSMRITRWLRYHCGVWAQPEGKWIEADTWDACYRERASIEPGEVVVLGLDFARRYDHAGLVAVKVVDPEVGRVVVKRLRTWKPEEEDGGKIPYWRVKNGVREACQEYAVAAVGFDKLGGFAQSAEELEDEGVPMVEVSMNSAKWGPLTAQLDGLISAQKFEHDGDEELRQHVIDGETQDSQHGERLHGRIPEKVDLLMGMGCAVDVALNTDALTEGPSPWERRAELGEALL